MRQNIAHFGKQIEETKMYTSRTITSQFYENFVNIREVCINKTNTVVIVLKEIFVCNVM